MRRGRRSSSSDYHSPSDALYLQDCFFADGAAIIRSPMAKPHTLLARLLQTPDLPAIVPRLQPEVLHRVIQACGLEDCGEFVALATPAQLTRLLDLDVWRGGGAGRDDVLDGDRFGLWIDVLVQCGPAVAAEKLLALDHVLVVSGLMEHVIVYDQAVVAGYTTLDGERVPARHQGG